VKKLLLSTAMLLGLLAPALAQVNSVPQVGLVTDFLRKPTYSATAVGLVPAASATDIFCISGSTSRNVSIRKLVIAGTAGTAITTPFLLYQRSALDTGGTAATGLALPVAVPLNSTDPASTAVLTAYTANPTVAASPLLMDAVVVDLPVTTAGTIGVTTYYGSAVDDFNKGMDLVKNTTLQYCVNLNGVSVSSGVLSIHIEWQEQ
jgi:hypothetical protein